MPGTWNGWRGTSDFADCAVLYGNRILFCKKLKKAPRMVHRNKALQKAFGQLCQKARDDDGHEAAGYLYGDRNDGDQFPLYETCAGGKNLPRGCMGVASLVFFPSGKDDQACRGSKRIIREGNGNDKNETDQITVSRKKIHCVPGRVEMAVAALSGGDDLSGLHAVGTGTIRNGHKEPYARLRHTGSFCCLSTVFL